VSAQGAVFLSYASQDTEAARRICEALRSGGVEVWFDQEGGLEHGDEWDAKIRRQIRECVLFIPVISAHTQARHEGYFRIEWDLAAERSQGFAQGVPFILPVAIDDTREAEALVPDRFRRVQWTRLPGGAVPPDVLARFLKLWSHRTGASSNEDQRSVQAAHSRGQVSPPRSRVRLGIAAYAGIAAAILALAAGTYWWVFASRKGAPNTPVSNPAAPNPTATPAAPLSEARQIAARVRAMTIDYYGSTAADFAAGEGMMKHALELDPNDAEVLAVSSQLNRSYLTRGFDYSEERTATARSQAERALRIDPNSIEALYAFGSSLGFADLDQAEATMQKILALDPGYWKATYTMALIRGRQNRLDEAVALLERLAVKPEHAALATYIEFLDYFARAMFPEADRAIRRSIAAEPSSNSEGGLAMLLVTWKGDTDGAARSLANAPTLLRDEHRTIWVTAWVQLTNRAPDDVLATLARLPDDFIQDNWFFGPKAYFVGRAQALAGRPDAARVAWETALAEVQSRLAEKPDELDLRLSQGQLFALLGREDEALREARTIEEMQSGRNAPWFVSPALIYAELGRANDAIPRLEKLLKVPRGNVGGNWPLTSALLRVDPMWDRLRGDPRFAALASGAPMPEAGK
jgi:tetratricopeptide (TPR) repeat protein